MGSGILINLPAPEINLCYNLSDFSILGYRTGTLCTILSKLGTLAATFHTLKDMGRTFQVWQRPYPEGT